MATPGVPPGPSSAPGPSVVPACVPPVPKHRPETESARRDGEAESTRRDGELGSTPAWQECCCAPLRGDGSGLDPVALGLTLFDLATCA